MSAPPDHVINAFRMQFKGAFDPSIQGPRSFSAARSVSYCSIVAERIGANACRPIDPTRHSLGVPYEKDGQKATFLHTWQDSPWIVRSNAINCGIDDLRATLRAEFLAREAVVLLEAKAERTEEDEGYLQMAHQLSNYFTRFHREVWDIREPASDDSAQRELQAKAVAKRKINGMTGRKYAEKAEDID